MSPKFITGTFFDTKLSKFGLADLPFVAILDFQMSIYLILKEFQEQNSITGGL